MTAGATFYLGTHIPKWLSFVDANLFVSHRRLREVKTLWPARSRWALDSGGFSELSKFGRWTIGEQEYIDSVRRYSGEIGKMEWAAQQDWMCEPNILALTGLTVAEHQKKTVRNYLSLVEKAPDIPWIPVVQGWLVEDYERCADLYESHGVGLAGLPTVGVGSVCRRQGTATAEKIFRTLCRRGLRLHGFGVKKNGLLLFGDAMVSADSMAWSFAARRDKPLPGHPHKNCANCLEYALLWKEALERSIASKKRWKAPLEDQMVLEAFSG